jgi:predicted RNA-binding Zn-ribbon protein involved in translation (DUF1610 family)
MDVSGQCANCGAPLPPDQPADHRYCAKCAAAWKRGNAAREQGAPVEDDAAPAVAAKCANCGAPLPPDQPADHRYCAKCAAAWQGGGKAAREKSRH